MQININDKVNKIVKNNPEIKEVLAELGFTEILKPGKLETVGRFVSLKTGSKMRDISLEYIIEKLREKGYSVTIKK